MKKKKIEMKHSSESSILKHVADMFEKRTCKDVLSTEREFEIVMQLYRKQIEDWKRENDHKLGEFIFKKNDWACGHVLSFLSPQEICNLSRVNKHTYNASYRSNAWVSEMLLSFTELPSNDPMNILLETMTTPKFQSVIFADILQRDYKRSQGYWNRQSIIKSATSPHVMGQAWERALREGFIVEVTRPKKRKPNLRRSRGLNTASIMNQKYVRTKKGEEFIKMWLPVFSTINDPDSNDCGLKFYSWENPRVQFLMSKVKHVRVSNMAQALTFERFVSRPMTHLTIEDCDTSVFSEKFCASIEVVTLMGNATVSNSFPKVDYLVLTHNKSDFPFHHFPALQSLGYILDWKSGVLFSRPFTFPQTIKRLTVQNMVKIYRTEKDPKIHMKIEGIYPNMASFTYLTVLQISKSRRPLYNNLHPSSSCIFSRRASHNFSFDPPIQFAFPHSKVDKGLFYIEKTHRYLYGFHLKNLDPKVDFDRF